jgi:hypothetical protein
MKIWDEENGSIPKHYQSASFDLRLETYKRPFRFRAEYEQDEPSEIRPHPKPSPFRKHAFISLWLSPDGLPSKG